MLLLKSSRNSSADLCLGSSAYDGLMYIAYMKVRSEITENRESAFVNRVDNVLKNVFVPPGISSLVEGYSTAI